MKNKKPFVREVILVEGKYDKNTLSQIVDAAIVTTDGFSVFQDREKLAFFRGAARFNCADGQRRRGLFDS